jgi:vancomycin resistance protein VanJ
VQIDRENKAKHAAARRPRRHRWLIPACGLYTIVLLLVWLVLGHAGDRSWPGVVLLLMPRWPLLAMMAVLWLWTGLLRRWSAVALLLAMTWFTLVPVMGCRLALPSSSARGDLRVLTFNVHRRQLDVAGLAKYIDEVKPDVVALQDWSQTHGEALFADGSWNLKRHGEFLVASRTTIVSITPIDMAPGPGMPHSEQGEAAMFVINTPGGLIALINVHFASPHIGVLALRRDSGEKLEANMHRRWLESRLTQAFAEGVGMPTLVVGDFNATRPSPVLREHWSSFTDAFEAGGSGCGYTYFHNYTQLRIDHVFVGKSWKVVGCQVGPALGSPHRPLVVDLSRK